MAAEFPDPTMNIGSHHVSSTQVAPWPAAFDIKTDTTKQGKAELFQQQLVSALRTRKLDDVLEEMPPTVDDLIAAYEAEGVKLDMDTANRYLDIALQVRQKKLDIVADNLQGVIKIENLQQLQRSKLIKMIQGGKGLDFYLWILEHTTIDKGYAQDRIREYYQTIKISPTDSAEQIMKTVVRDGARKNLGGGVCGGSDTCMSPACND